MTAAIALAGRTRGLTAPNPNVGCIIVRDGRVIGRGWTQAGGRPHAEASAIADAGGDITGATVYATLEPCAHASPRGPACADLLSAAQPARVVIGAGDPDPRTNGKGAERLRAAGIEVTEDIEAAACRASMAGFLTRIATGRPQVTLKLGLSIDGGLAMDDGRSRWITGAAARAHAHVERARHELILVGRGTITADAPKLDVRVAGLESRSPRPVLISSNAAATPAGWLHIASPDQIASLPGDHLMIEGGAGAAAAFLAVDLVDRMLVYRAPVLIGAARTLGDIGLTDLSQAHGRWQMVDMRALGGDRLEIYERRRS
ncbi:bifunctional diaminohydroxyphosphoribosylaminopyrimidine deaminase/5-amino-6-(5-phosphoribosylamino)uracil reductase RibD [Sphingomonas montanisoli]|uniref:Riboflavin biosynthesis protein RibD n=1 Tax=Sphingomonas montanisoli TaxID=2606412 RepID=A0A5D9C7R0_9SPHN|nr:bifunctional diaminohydroxyphosphoribosylaminopyrimidine deaminase/5-amino-6-(5-phosphoribosylamino)uracil reductase RibD [Sphingomonas montanisoli]TZG27172.1 bifunctional diaminohydroxyphosphoribosylaminopyrimidine deaminase/5-amino-6-(5-phosphoribosylamino)uracil reductase RibD [Sphingomonas montanisoli]